MELYTLAGMSVFLATYQMSKGISEAEESNQESNTNPLNPIPKFLNQFEIPKLLKERETKKQEEYQQREEIDLRQIEKGISKEEYEEMKELDRILRLSTDQSKKRGTYLYYFNYIDNTSNNFEEIMQKHENEEELDLNTRDMSMKMKP